ncbi:unnamed protein product [Phytophthora lilii]|uniref:Unnamed protein product n=1 Tax=Phytophthora lilii TaxID=2077276 RepID=A0A9W7D7B7_9STRA|nr:unnamed protein product [Phytophthora lilii]
MVSETCSYFSSNRCGERGLNGPIRSVVRYGSASSRGRAGILAAMVSSRWRAASPASSISSCSGLSGCHEEYEAAQAEEDRGVEDEREVARRVLEDLEKLYFDESDDGESEDKDDFECNSERISDTSSRVRADRRTACGMTLEELTVAVNAAIEYHRPAKSVKVKPFAGGPTRESIVHSSPHLDAQRYSRRYSIESSTASQQGESTLEDFREMLKRKERQFYEMKTIRAEEDNQSPPSLKSGTGVAIQETSVMPRMRDIATETDHFQELSISFTRSEFHTPQQSPAQSEHGTYGGVPEMKVKPVILGPTLADLAKCCDESANNLLSAQMHSVAGLSPSLASASPVSSKFRRSFGSSFNSDRRITSRNNASFKSSSSSSSSTSNRSNRSRSSRSECSSSNSGSSQLNNRASRSSSSSSSKVSSTSLNSTCSKSSWHNDHLQAGTIQHQQFQEPSQQLYKWELPLDREITVEKDPEPAYSPLPLDMTCEPNSSGDVRWELDLSDFST